MSIHKDQKKLYFYMISDASGETVSVAAKAISAQFDDNVIIEERLFLLVRSLERFECIMEEIAKCARDAPVVVLYTILEEKMKLHIEKRCKESNILPISILEGVASKITAFANIPLKSHMSPGKYSRRDHLYDQKIEVIDFALLHDDGENFSAYNAADVVLFGVSRTSKSPTAIQLALRGYKAANWPVVQDIAIDLSELKKPLLVGLTVSAEALYYVRCHRLGAYEAPIKAATVLRNKQEYAEIQAIKAELDYALKFFHRHKMLIVDVTHKAVEEIAMEIIKELIT